MKRVYGLVAISVLFISCTQAQAPAPAGTSATASKAYGTLAQMMRGIPFPNSNIIFDTQSVDPTAAQKPAEGQGATSQYSGVYGGWQAVENAALALQETANLLTVPGRLCENGRPVPVDQEDFRRWTQGLADAGAAAYKAAQSKNMDQMVEVSGTVADACAACHEKYRDKDDLSMRCVP
jgi:hypothetical protein